MRYLKISAPASRAENRGTYMSNGSQRVEKPTKVHSFYVEILNYELLPRSWRANIDIGTPVYAPEISKYKVSLVYQLVCLFNNYF